MSTCATTAAAVDAAIAGPRWRRRLRFGAAGLLVLSVALTGASAWAQAPAAARNGKRLFAEKMCYTCHGYEGQGGERGSGPRIAPGVWPYPAFLQQVRHPRQDMPRYPAAFTSDAELADMHAYLTTIRPARSAAELAPLRD